MLDYCSPAEWEAMHREADRQAAWSPQATCLSNRIKPTLVRRPGKSGASHEGASSACDRNVAAAIRFRVGLSGPIEIMVPLSQLASPKPCH